MPKWAEPPVSPPSMMMRMCGTVSGSPPRPELAAWLLLTLAWAQDPILARGEWVTWARGLVVFFIVATIWLVQRGSNESKPIENAGLESEKMQKLGPHAGPKAPRWARLHGGFRRRLYSNSLLLVMSAIFLLSWFGQSVTGRTEYNAEQSDHDRPTVSWASYVTTGSFWEDTLENWQSEFLAVGTMAIFTVYLRQRGSPESKPVGAAHDETGASG